jgi:catabolite repression protein CreC
MDNESTFVAPEGVYSVTEEHKPAVIPVHTSVNSTTGQYHARVSAIVVKFPPAKLGPAQGFAQLLGNVGGNKDAKKDKDNALKPPPTASTVDAASLESSSDTPDDGEAGPITPDVSPSIPAREPGTLFSHSTAGSRKKGPTRPKHNLRNTNSTFISRFQNAEGRQKQGEMTFMFYNAGKNFIWVEAGAKSKVCSPSALLGFPSL